MSLSFCRSPLLTLKPISTPCRTVIHLDLVVFRRRRSPKTEPHAAAGHLRHGRHGWDGGQYASSGQEWPHV
jgi:hypothetical protein